MPWKTIMLVTLALLCVAGGVAFALRQAPVSSLDGVWETADQESVLYVDTKAGTITYEGPAPVQTRTEVYSSSGSSSGPTRTIEGTSERNVTLKLWGAKITPQPGAAFQIAVEETTLRAKLQGKQGLKLSTTAEGSVRGLARTYRRQ